MYCSRIGWLVASLSRRLPSLPYCAILTENNTQITGAPAGIHNDFVCGGLRTRGEGVGEGGMYHEFKCVYYHYYHQRANSYLPSVCSRGAQNII